LSHSKCSPSFEDSGSSTFTMVQFSGGGFAETVVASDILQITLRNDWRVSSNEMGPKMKLLRKAAKVTHDWSQECVTLITR
jgi:hypothetical protein